jgi:nucleoside phosphorylase
MEAYGAAWACQQLRVPFAVVVGITNVVGPTAHAEWLARRFSVQTAVREWVRGRFLRR